MQLPNVVLLSVDCLRADAVFDSEPSTPFLARFARQFTSFERHFSTGTWTAPSFVGLMTGEQPRSFSHDLSVHAYPETLAETLQRRGYDTFAVLDSNYWISSEQGFDRGFRRFNNYVDAASFVGRQRGGEDGEGNELVAEAPDWLVERFPSIVHVASRAIGANDTIFGIARKLDMLRPPTKMGIGGERLLDQFCDTVESVEEPFFGWAHLMDLHHPYLPAHSGILERIKRPGFLTSYVNNKSTRLGEQLTEGQVDYYQSLYFEKLTEVDGILESGVERIREAPLDRDTVFVIVGDHGDEFHEHGRVNHANKPYNELIHVPLLIGVGEGETVDRNTTSLGFKPAIEAVLRGESDWMTSMEASNPVCRYLHHGDHVTERTWKALDGVDTPSQVMTLIDDDEKVMFDAEGNQIEIYDLASDFYEQQNIYEPGTNRDLIRNVLAEHERERIELTDTAIVSAIDP